MFLLNSRLDLDSATISGFTREGLHPNMAPLLPKLRGQFAEFLRESYLAHLGILYLTTCVGLGYGHSSSWLSPLFLAAWHLRDWSRGTFPTWPHRNARADLPTRTSYAFGGDIHSPLSYSLLRPDLAPSEL